MKTFERRIAVITGGAGGIGAALAREAASRGMHVVLADKNVSGLEALGDELAANASGKILTRETDVTNIESVEALAAFVAEELGAPHVLINNAGVASGGVIWECTPEQWRFGLDVNLWGAIHMCRAFVPGMIAHEDQGCIVNVASIAGLVSPGLTGIYNVSKHALVAYSETLHHDLHMRKTQLSVCLVCPAWVRTNILDATPAAPPSSPQAEYETLQTALRSVIARGLEPATLATTVFDAVAAGRFYVLTPPDTLELIKRHYEAIADGARPHAPAMGVKKPK